MKQLFITSFFVLLILKSQGQVTKGNWLVGGNAIFSSAHYKSDATADANLLTIGINPKIGHFFIDKFAVGLMANYSFSHTKISSSSQNFTTFTFGPYLRYYFLSPKSRVNILGETGYQYGIEKGSGNNDYKTNGVSFAAGPVVYFNSTVGIEFTIGYSVLKYINYNNTNNYLQIAIGLQVHLEKLGH